MKAYPISEEDAKIIAEQDLSEITHDGYETKNNYCFAILNCDTKMIGSLWLFLRGEGEQKTPYLVDLFIAPKFRNQGNGKQALSLLETELKFLGIKNNIAVHVIGDFNEAAIRLFRSSGYFVTTIKLEKIFNP